MPTAYSVHTSRKLTVFLKKIEKKICNDLFEKKALTILTYGFPILLTIVTELTDNKTLHSSLYFQLCRRGQKISNSYRLSYFNIQFEVSAHGSAEES
ncbi:hypothetical protein SUGI_0427950 [Cryptomeria japonica]|nr:hypothetical protein SUGI_0427950 [Cryptomeria japonica]